MGVSLFKFKYNLSVLVSNYKVYSLQNSSGNVGSYLYAASNIFTLIDPDKTSCSPWSEAIQKSEPDWTPMCGVTGTSLAPDSRDRDEGEAP